MTVATNAELVLLGGNPIEQISKSSREDPVRPFEDRTFIHRVPEFVAESFHLAMQVACNTAFEPFEVPDDDLRILAADDQGLTLWPPRNRNCITGKLIEEEHAAVFDLIPKPDSLVAGGRSKQARRSWSERNATDEA